MDLFIDNLSGVEFEYFLANVFKGLKYEVELTAASSDYGADLIIKKNNIVTVVQAKCYSSTVGLSAIQEVLGAKGYYNADTCLVVTNNFFTDNAYNLAISNSVELWDRNTLINNALISLCDTPDNLKSSTPLDTYNSEEEIVEPTIIEDDPLLDNAIDIILNSNEISASLLQRKLRIGFNRASKILEQLEKKNIISSLDKNHKRKILIKKNQNIDNPKKYFKKIRKLLNLKTQD